MKAVIYERYGPPEVLQIRDIPKPVPKESEVLIKVRATPVTAADHRLRAMDIPGGFEPLARLGLGLFKPRKKILGIELSGEIESVGKSVTRFKAGDAVFASAGFQFGCYVEYKCMAEDSAMALKPANLGYEQAAALAFGGATTLAFLKKAGVQSGEKILVNGASGAVGTAAVQISRQRGAEVTGVCGPANMDLVKSLGAAKVIDYTKEDFTKSGETYDIIMDNAGTAPYSRSKGSLKKGGRLLLVLGDLSGMLLAPLQTMMGDKKIIGGSWAATAEDMGVLAELAEKGHYKPVIDRTYPLEQIVEAHRYVDMGHKKGNVVVTL